MPLPSPHKGQSSKEFLKVCMSDPVMNKEFPDQSHRAAVCYQKLRSKSKAAAYIVTVGDDDYLYSKDEASTVSADSSYEIETNEPVSLPLKVKPAS